MTDIIRVQDAWYEYERADDEGELAVRGVSLSVRKGEWLSIIGRNGSGKSTLIKLLNGLFLPTRGSVTVGSYDTRDEEHIWDVRQRVGMIFQNPDNQIVATIVEEDVAFGLENLGVNPQEIRERVDAALRAVGMQEYAASAPHMLSGGLGGQLMAQACADCAAVFNCESGSESNEIVTERKGGAVIRITVKGIAAHAGRNPERGASAVRTAARLVEAIESLSSPDGVLFNCGRIEGGTGANIIPDSCTITLGLRHRTNADYEKALQTLEALCTETPLPGTSADFTVLGRYPAMEKTPGTDALAALYDEASRRLGFGKVSFLFAGGCSDSAFVTQTGVPTLCALGIGGANAHTKDEYALLSTMLPQCRKLVTTILSLPDDKA